MPCVYFIRTMHVKSMVKIGWTSNLRARLIDLQTGCPFTLRLMGLIECADAQHAAETEQMLHEKFRALRRRGEWFYYTDVIAKYLESEHGLKPSKIYPPTKHSPKPKP